MRHLLVCMGESLIDFLPIEEGGATVGFHMHPGGSLMNVAVGIARLEQPVAFASKVGDDFFGRYLRAYIESEGIDTRFLITAAAQSTLAFVAMEGAEAVYTFYDQGTADTLLTVEELPEELFDETSILHFGSISLLRGTTPAAVLATVERLKGKALLSLDPNLRPGLIRDEAGYRALLRRLMELVDIIKISAVDLSWLMPGQTVERAAAELLSHGAALVVVTRGGAGVLALRAADPPQYHTLPGFQVPVVDTVGAGDSFSAGLLAGLAERRVASRSTLEGMAASELDATLRFAAAVAELTCTRAGANPPRRAEVERFLSQH